MTERNLVPPGRLRAPVRRIGTAVNRFMAHILETSRDPTDEERKKAWQEAKGFAVRAASRGDAEVMTLAYGYLRFAEEATLETAQNWKFPE